MISTKSGNTVINPKTTNPQGWARAEMLPSPVCLCCLSLSMVSSLLVLPKSRNSQSFQMTPFLMASSVGKIILKVIPFSHPGLIAEESCSPVSQGFSSPYQYHPDLSLVCLCPSQLPSSYPMMTEELWFRGKWENVQFIFLLIFPSYVLIRQWYLVAWKQYWKATANQLSGNLFLLSSYPWARPQPFLESISTW